MGVFTGPQSFIHLFGSLLMTINRYTAACHPRIHHFLWKPKWTYSLLTLGIIASYVVHAPLFMNSFVYEVVDGKWMIVGWAEPIPYIRIMSVIVVITYEIISVILIIPTLYVVAKLNKVRTSKFRKEMGLVIILAMDCVLGAFDCAYETSDLMGFDRAMNPVLFFIEENFCLFLFLNVSLNAYVIIFLSSDLQEEVFEFLKVQRWRRTSVKSIKT
ncbi:unnamed protein product [Cylicocyclus nassatus]|uniref:Serpentine receptor class gamma n=1 Tax=Cylicocyclus nassatus TaxID=53992 RepID=A0AA36GRP0_CYLNA|nr:unnamed protein product [Cylicocyclus nassatus]